MKKYKNDIINILFIVLGTVVMAFAFNVFLFPNDISPSGFSGLSAILSILLAQIGINIPTSAIYLLLNAVLYIIAYRLLGKKFALMALIGILSFSVALELMALIPLVVEGDLLVCAIYGAGIMGLGTGLVLRNNGSTGGSDLLALIIRSKTQVLTTGQIMMALNIIVLALSCITYGFGPLMYSIITLALSSVVTDLVIDGATGVRAYYVFTTKKEEVCKAIYDQIGRGVTQIKAEGMYTHTERDILLCLLNKYRAPLLKHIVQKIDNEAFVFCTPVSEVIGRGFSVPVKKNKAKELADNISAAPQNTTSADAAVTENTTQETTKTEKETKTKPEKKTSATKKQPTKAKSN